MERYMKNCTRLKRQVAILALAAGTLLPSLAAAQAPQAPWQAEKWQFQGSLNLWLPSIGGNSKYPVDSGGSSVNVNSDKLLDSINGFFMGSLEAHNGRWGAFTDVTYFDLSGSKSGSRDFTIGNIGLPATTSANLGLNIKSTIWTLAGEYRVKSDPGLKVDLVAGARLLDVTSKLDWSIAGAFGNITAASRTGSLTANESFWDAIIGVKGRVMFGADRKWSVPFYLDVGTGQSDRTTQAAVGLAYTFNWGDVYATYRYLDYSIKSGKVLQDVNLSGPMLGATFRW
jgi:hypothetical protein